MRRMALLATLLTLAPLLAPPPALAQDAPADACREEEGLLVCQWSVDTREDPSLAYAWPLPDAAPALLQLTILFEGEDGGWAVSIFHDDQYVTGSLHLARGLNPRVRLTDTSDHLLVNDTNPSGWRMVLRPWATGTGDLHASGMLGVPTSRSLGTFRFTLVYEEIPEGVPFERPAASREHPHVRDAPYDSDQPATDVLAAWLDDARLDDGLIDAHLAMRDQSSIEFGSGGRINHVFSFHVDERRYFVTWGLSARQDGDASVWCVLGTTVNGNTQVIMTPACAWDRGAGEFTAVFPERSLGYPGVGEHFTNFRVDVYRFEDTATSVTTGAPTADFTRGERFPFALGGPEVWDLLNGGVFKSAPVAPLAWHQAPLAEDNLPDTLQVLGAAAATLTFLFGLLVVRRRRAQTRRILDEVDAVERAHERDAHRALLALGELESRFTRLFRDGDIQESQYQVVSQRIASVATRFALRRELGLDDGEPGTGAAR